MNRFSFESRPKANKTIRIGADIRVTVLTPCMVRIEKGKFTDLPTQTVWNRNFRDTQYEYHTDSGKLIVCTEETVFTVDLRSGEMEKILLSDGRIATISTAVFRWRMVFYPVPV